MMRYTIIALLTGSALALAGCGGSKTETSTTTNSVTTQADSLTVDTNVTTPVLSPGQAFANAAASSDAFEIAESQLAQTASKSAAIKAFAQKMIDAHTGSTTKLKAAAASATPAITPDATLTAEQQQKLDALKAQTGADFDTAYAADQVAAHQATLDALKTYSATGDVPELKTFATGLVPTVTAHLNMAKGLKP
jgi:putative membrane protein